MSNPYYNFLIQFNDGQTIRAAQVNAEFQAIATAFDNAVFGSWDPSQTYIWTGIQNFVDATVVGLSISDLAEVQADTPEEGDIMKYVGGSWVLAEDATAAAAASFDEAGNYVLTGEWDFSAATVTGISISATVDEAANYAWTGSHTINGNDVLHKGNINETTVGINTQAGAAYTAVLADRNGLINTTSASAVTITIPENANVAYPVGTTISFCQIGTGELTIDGEAGVTLNTEVGLKIKAQYGFATAIKIASDTWVVSGSLSA